MKIIGHDLYVGQQNSNTNRITEDYYCGDPVPSHGPYEWVEPTPGPTEEIFVVHDACGKIVEARIKHKREFKSLKEPLKHIKDIKVECL